MKSQPRHWDRRMGLLENRCEKPTKQVIPPHSKPAIERLTHRFHTYFGNIWELFGAAVGFGLGLSERVEKTHEKTQ